MLGWMPELLRRVMVCSPTVKTVTEECWGMYVSPLNCSCWQGPGEHACAHSLLALQDCYLREAEKAVRGHVAGPAYLLAEFGLTMTQSGEPYSFRETQTPFPSFLAPVSYPLSVCQLPSSYPRKNSPRKWSCLSPRRKLKRRWKGCCCMQVTSYQGQRAMILVLIAEGHQQLEESWQEVLFLEGWIAAIFGSWWTVEEIWGRCAVVRGPTMKIRSIQPALTASRGLGCWWPAGELCPKYWGRSLDLTALCDQKSWEGKAVRYSDD